MQVNQTTNSAVGAVRQSNLTPPEMRSKILNAVGEGFNTQRAICRETGLEERLVIRELEFMEEMYLVRVPGPPLDSWWIKSKKPQGRIFIDEQGRAVEIKEKRQKRNIPPPEPEETVSETSIETLELPDVSTDDEFRCLPLKYLAEHPDNPRGFVDEQESSFAELVESIRSVGVQEPLIVTPAGKAFRIVIGHRRNKAARAAGLKTVPVIIRRFSSREQEEDVMLIENIQRQNLKPTQEAKAFKRLYLQSGKNIHAVARRVGLTQSYISNRIKLLDLHLGIQLMIDRGELNLEAGVILSSLDAEKQMKLLPRAQRMKTADLRELVRRVRDNGKITVPAERKKQIEAKRATTDDEKFTRSGALKSLDAMGDAAWISVEYLRRAFDDVCIDACLETKNEEVCRGCPMPRFVEAITRRKLKEQ